MALSGTDGLSCLTTSFSTAAELLEDRIDAAATNGVHWGSHSTSVAAMSHFLKLKTDLEVLGFGRSMDLIEDKADALWTSDLLASYVPSSVAHNPPDGQGGGSGSSLCS
jgi:hypothetical protein